MSGYPPLKKPKIEREEENPEEEPEENEEAKMEEQVKIEQEEAFVALVEHRTKEVEHLRQRITYYKSQLDAAEKRLEDTQIKLARLRGRNITVVSQPLKNGMAELKAEKKSLSPNHPPYVPQSLSHDTVNSAEDNLKFVKRPHSPFYKSELSSQNQTQSKPQLVIPSMAPKIPQPVKVEESGNRLSSSSGSLRTEIAQTHVNDVVKLKREKARKISSEQEAVETQHKGAKQRLEQSEHKDLIPLISTSSTPRTIHCQSGCFISSQHKRKLRSLILCPTIDQLFATSALDGVVNLWQVQGRGSGASLLSSTDCQSDKQRRWPEDIAWHPQGNKLFLVYSADSGDSQVSILNLNKGKEKARVNFLVDKPHVKGIINSIIFTPWDDTFFVTGGSDHAVVLWSDKDGDDSWKPKPLHRNNHSSAVMGVAGMNHRKIVMSVGADKRIVGFDVEAGRSDYRHQIDSKCMSVLPNPCDFNLFMVQTGTPERQLRLFDLRLRGMEVHSFGWKQESSESQSALINQAWSPDGLYLTSGSADPSFHIFDIRCNAHKPSQSVRAHQKRVFKAAWHHALPILISISSDLNIGLHKI